MTSLNTTPGDTTPTPRPVGKLGYQPALDGLRAVAVGLVVLHHLESPTSGVVRGAANIGVDVFFVISGFLITRLMLDEHWKTGRISLIDFWKRRALRLLPLAVAVIGIVWLIDLVWSNAFYRAGADVSSTRSAIAALTYHMNFMMMFESTAHEWALTHTWSLSIEEQFYVIWPLIVVGLVLVARRTPALAVLVASSVIIVASSVIRFVNADDLDRLYNGIDARAGQLCMGCALGALTIVSPRAVATLGRFGPFALLMIGAIAVAFDITFRFNGFGFDIVAILSATAVAGSINRSDDGAYTRLATSPPAVWLGTRSYAIYLVHYPLFLALTPERLDMFPRPVMWAIRVVLGLALAEVAHRLVERPVARYRTRNAA